ncbi:MAG: hypothetical protein K6L80_07880 [Agarilytica sp.]
MFARALCLVFGFSAGVSAVEFRGADYDVYLGDVNGDGINDIYFHPNDELVLIQKGELV